MVRRATHGARAPCPRWPTDGWIKLSHAGTGHTLDGNYYIGTVPGATGQLGNGYTLQERLARRGKAIARRRCPGGALLSHPQLNSLRLGRWRWRTPRKSIHEGVQRSTPLSRSTPGAGVCRQIEYTICHDSYRNSQRTSRPARQAQGSAAAFP